MFKKIAISLLIIAVAGIFCITGFSGLAGADGVGAGSESDPVVTASYVTKYFSDEIQRFMDSVVKPFVGQYVDGNVQWEVSNLAAGQVLIGQAGAEIIVRTGQAVIVDNTVNGIPDLTAGADLKAGSPAPLNHHLVIPRSDGRGIMAQGSIWVMYRGQVSVQ
ncbi:MAG: hypothetical protein WCY82_08830 [Desulfotomaculaceae bacterium]